MEQDSIRCETCGHFDNSKMYYDEIRDTYYWYCKFLEHPLENGQAMIYHSKRCGQ